MNKGEGLRTDYVPKVVNLIQMLLDYLTVVISFMLGYGLYHLLLSEFDIGVGVQPFKIYRNLAIGAGFLILIIFERFGLYSRQVGMLNVGEIKRILQSLLIGSMILFSLSFLFRPIMSPGVLNSSQISPAAQQFPDLVEQGSLLYSRLILMYSLVILLVLANLQRSLVNQILMYRHIKGPGLYRVAIYGAGTVGCQIHRRLFENPKIGMKPIGYIDDDLDKVGQKIIGIVGKEETTIPVLGNELQLPELMRSWEIHEVIIAMPNASTARIYEIINACVQARVKFSFVPNLFDMFIQQVHFEEIEGIPLLRMKSQRISYIYLAAKRLFDFLLALAFMFLTAPLIPLILLFIKLDSPGPLLFIQKRVGKDGRLFKMYKFRSMYIDANNYECSPLSNKDPRITRVGRWLRMCSLDELPQFINVIKGDMSLVGPRPEMPFVVDEYTPIQRQRLTVRPGITGIWQISSARSEAIHENIDYDLFYTENQSFLLDLVVIVKTIAAAFKGRGV